MSGDFDPFTKFDPNAWYYLSESRVDNYTNSEFTSNFHTTTESRLEVSGKREKQMWQFHPVDEDKNPGRYYARLNYFGPWKQLSVCQVSGEKSVGNTWPCMMDSEPKAESQMWDVQLWGGDEEYLRLVNVGNGTENWLDVHKGNPVYMRSEKDEDNDNLGDKWLYTSVGRVNDEKYSTVFNAAAAVDSPQTTDGSAPPSGTPNSGDDSNTSEDSDSGLSAGATAGIGAGVGLAVVFLGVLIFWLLRRRKNTANRGVELSSGSPMAAGSAPDKGVYAGSMAHSQNTAANPHGWDHSTQSASPPQGQQNAYYPQQGGAYTQINGPYQAGTGNENRPHELGGAAPAEMPSDRY